MFFSIYHFLEPFITIWLGSEYVLGRDILLLLCILRYFNASRVIVEVYNHAHGLFADVWAAWTELAINVAITLIAGYFWGISGILLGKVISVGLLVVLWKPYYLFKSGLHMSYKSYWLGVYRNYLVAVASFIITHLILSIIPINAAEGYIPWVLYCIIGMSIYLTINLTLIMLFCKGAKDSILRIKSIITKES
jgi:hypothetical protein